MKVSIAIAGSDVCIAEIWEARVPRFAPALRNLLPVTSIAQHGKIVGDLLYFSLPTILPQENVFPLQNICRDRRRERGSAGGAVCFYAPRQQICIYYGDDVADEPFDVSYIGEIVDGELALQVAAMKCWTSPGEIVTFQLR